MGFWKGRLLWWVPACFFFFLSFRDPMAFAGIHGGLEELAVSETKTDPFSGPLPSSACSWRL